MQGVHRPNSSQMSSRDKKAREETKAHGGRDAFVKREKVKQQTGKRTEKNAASSQARASTAVTRKPRAAIKKPRPRDFSPSPLTESDSEDSQSYTDSSTSDDDEAAARCRKYTRPVQRVTEEDLRAMAKYKASKYLAEKGTF